MLKDSTFYFRAATPGDVTAIRDLVRAAYAKWVAVIGREPRPMTADYEQAVQQHQLSLLCLGADSVGLIVGLIETMGRGDHLWIENVAVAPAHQGKGLGRLLLAHAEDAAIAGGLPETRLLTNAAFRPNVVLYEALGYIVTRQEPFMGGVTLYMSKRLGQTGF